MSDKKIKGNKNILIQGNNNIININYIKDDEMTKKMKTNKKALKKYAVKTKNNTNSNTKYEFEVFDFEPTDIYMPKKYYTAKMRYKPEVEYLEEGDIAIIDPSIKKVIESGIYAFEYKGYVMVRQFQVMPFGYKDVKGKKAYRSVGSSREEIYPHDEVNILGAVISKQKELFHGLYYNNPMQRAYGVK